MFSTCATKLISTIIISYGLFSTCHAQVTELDEPIDKKISEQVFKKVPSQPEIISEAVKLSREDLSQLKHPKKPMLWKVEGPALKKASYLFGSIHVSDENIAELHPLAEKAFQQSDTVATEVNMGIINQIRIAKRMIRNDGLTLKASIGDELYEKLNHQLEQISPIYSADIFNDFKTWSVFLSFGFLEEQLKGGEPLDSKLQKRAAKEGKRIWHLESLNQSLGGFDTLTEKEQIILLRDALNFQRIEKQHKFTTLQILKNLYLKGDPDLIIPSLERFNHLEGVNLKVSEKFMKLLLNDRNNHMADKILKTLSEQPDQSHFVIAGTLHYLGENSVIHLLRNKGYIVTRQK